MLGYLILIQAGGVTKTCDVSKRQLAVEERLTTGLF